jgi:hypothetical protein
VPRAHSPSADKPAAKKLWHETAEAAQAGARPAAPGTVAEV